MKKITWLLMLFFISCVTTYNLREKEGISVRKKGGELEKRQRIRVMTITEFNEIIKESLPYEIGSLYILPEAVWNSKKQKYEPGDYFGIYENAESTNQLKNCFHGAIFDVVAMDKKFADAVFWDKLPDDAWKKGKTKEPYPENIKAKYLRESHPYKSYIYGDDFKKSVGVLMYLLNPKKVTNLNPHNPYQETQPPR